MTWTNMTIRRQLGEAGFIKTNIDVETNYPDYTGTVWNRNGVLVDLWEHRDEIHQPFVTDHRTQVAVDPRDLGVRNVNIQPPKDSA